MNIQPTNTVPVEVTGTEKPVFRPAADIDETPDAILIRCEMPGVPEENVEILLENKVLKLRGTQVSPSREGFQARILEYRSGIYQRSFQLHRDVDEAGVKARLKNGVLEIEVPKQKPAEARRIPIEN